MANPPKPDEPRPLAPGPDAEAIEILDAYLDWCQKHKAARTYAWYREEQAHPTKAYLASWIARIFSLKNSRSRKPYACRFIVLILLFVPSSGPVLIRWS